MATEVDNRVVQMTFNNSQFEKGVDKTLKTIDKLNKALKFEDASKGFDEIQNAANSIDLRTISDKIDALTNKFSPLGVIGMRVFSNIGDEVYKLITGPFRALSSAVDNTFSAISNQVKQGGWNRALNLEQAQILIEGMGKAWVKGGEEIIDGVDNIYPIVDKAVTGTAYSLDQAAKAAANFLSSGVDAGDGSLLGTLRAVTGVAATTSTDFDRVAHIFAKVAGQGRLMGEDLNSIATMGINAAAELADVLGTDQAAIRDMVSKGQIDFETFANVMEDKFGDQAMKANETFTGALSNVKSALSRIGARFAEPLLEGIIKPLNEARLMVNEFGKALDNSGITGFIENTIGSASKKIVNAFTYVDSEGVMQLNASVKNFFYQVERMFNGVRAGFYAIGHVFDIFKESWTSVFGKKSTDSIFKFATKFRDTLYSINHQIATNTKVQDKLRTVFTGVLTVAKIFFSILKTGLKVVGKVIKLVAKLAYNFLYLGSKIILAVKGFIDWIKQTEQFKKIVETTTKIVNGFKSGIDKIIDSISKLISKFIEFVKKSGIVQRGIKVLKGVFKTLYESINVAWTVIKGVFTGLYESIKDFFTESQFVKDASGFIKDAFDSIKDSIGNAVGAVKDWAESKWENVSYTDIRDNIVEFFTGTLPDKIHEFGEKLEWAFANPNEAARLLLEKLKDFKETVEQGFGNAVKTVGDKMTELKEKLSGAGDSVKEFSERDDIDPKKVEEKFSIFTTIGDSLSKAAEGFRILGEGLSTIFTTMFGAIGSAFEKVKDYAKDMTFADFIDLIKDFVNMLVGLNLAEAAKNLAQFFNDINKAFSSNLNKNTKLDAIPKAMLMISGAIFILALALEKFGGFEGQDMIDAAASILIIFGAISIIISHLTSSISTKDVADTNVATNALAKIGDTFKHGLEYFMKKISNAAAIGMTAVALAGSIATIMLAFMALLAVIDSVKPATVTSALMVLGAISIVIFVIVAILLKLVDESKSGGKKLVAGMAGVAAVMAAIALTILTTVAAIVIIAGILEATSAAGNENFFWKGLGAFAAVMGVMLVMVAILAAISVGMEKLGGGNSLGSLIGLAVLILAVSAAALLILPTLSIFAAMDGDDLRQAVLGIIGVFFAMAVIIAISAVVEARKTSGGLLATIALMAVAALVLVAVMYSLSVAAEASKDVDMGSLVAGLIGMLVLVVVLGIIGSLLTKGKSVDQMAGIAAVILSFGASILLMAIGLKKLGEVDASKVWEAIIPMLVIILILSVAGAVIGNVPGMAKGMEALGIAMLGLGAGLFLIAAAVYLLGPILNEFAENYETFSKGVEGLTTILVDILMSFITKFIDALKAKIGTFAYQIGDLLLALVIGIVVWLTDRAFQIGIAIGDFFWALTEIIVVALCRFADNFMGALRSPDGFDSNSPSKKLLELGVDIILGLIEGIGSMLKALWDKLTDLVAEFIQFFVDLASDIFEAGSNIISSVWDGIESAWTWVKDKVQGIADGIFNIFDGLSTKVEGLMEDIFGDPQEKVDELIAARDEANRIAEAGHRDSANIEPYEDELAEYRQKIEDVEGKITYINAYFRDNKVMSDTIRKGMNEKLAEYTEEFKGYYEAVKDIYAKADYWGEESWGVRGTSHGAAYQVGQWIGSGYQLGIYNSIGDTDYLAQIVGNQVDTLKRSLGIASPSKVFMKIGGFMIAGLNKGLNEEFEYTKSILGSFANTLSTFDGNTTTPRITPVLDLSNIQNGVNYINGNLGNKQIHYLANMDIKSDSARNAERINDLTAAVNNLTIKSDQSDISGKLGSQSEILNRIADGLENQTIVLDSGALVGGISKKMDKSLGHNQYLRTRGAY